MVVKQQEIIFKIINLMVIIILIILKKHFENGETTVYEKIRFNFKQGNVAWTRLPIESILRRGEGGATLLTLDKLKNRKLFVDQIPLTVTCALSAIIISLLRSEINDNFMMDTWICAQKKGTREYNSQNEMKIPDAEIKIMHEN